MNRRSTRTTIAVASVVATLATACSAHGSAASSPNVKSDLTIGISLSLSGDFSNTGLAGEKGYQLWASQVNAQGGVLGRHVTLMIADDASNPVQAVTNYTNFITRDKVSLVFGPYSSLLTLPSAKLAQRYGYAFVEGAGNGPSVFAACLPNLVFAGPATSVNGGIVWSQFIHSLPASEQPKTAAYPSLDDPFSLPEAQALQKVFEADGVKTVYSNTYPAAITDLTPVMAHVASVNPDMVVSGSQDSDGWAQVKAMIQLKFSPRLLFLANGPENPVDFPNNVGRANTNGIFTSNGWTPDTGTPNNSSFVKAYLAKFGGTAQGIDSTSAETFAVGQLVEAVAAKTGKVDNQTLIAELHKGTWSTIMGDISIDKCGAPSGTLSLNEWIGGKLYVVYPPSVANHTPVIPKPAWP
jgi:branched-chain amino acid transport system substrate-binding protein